MSFKIYTKTGDKGQTSLLGGTRVPKHHMRIESYGTVDELNSCIGLIRDQKTDEHTRAMLIEIQDRLFTIGASLAIDPEKSNRSGDKAGIKIPLLNEKDVEMLEKEMDRMNEVLPEMKSFVLPGGHTTVSYCHIARCVCRRAERITVQLSENSFVSELVVKYLNRLSDYLFVLSRKLSMDLNAEEIAWKPRM
jgi:cob(I)alamin adenosyltransferase